MSRQGDAGGTTGFDDWCSQAACMGNQCGAFKARVAYALRYAISQLVLKCLVPGVPDFYQGCEDWTFTLTDPDNRRPVDFVNASDRLAHSYDTSGMASRNLKMRTNLLQQAIRWGGRPRSLSGAK